MLGARGGNNEVPGSKMLQAAPLAFIFKTSYHFSGDYLKKKNLPGAEC